MKITVGVGYLAQPGVPLGAKASEDEGSGKEARPCMRKDWPNEPNRSNLVTLQEGLRHQLSRLTDKASRKLAAAMVLETGFPESAST